MKVFSFWKKVSMPKNYPILAKIHYIWGLKISKNDLFEQYPCKPIKNSTDLVDFNAIIDHIFQNGKFCETLDRTSAF